MPYVSLEFNSFRLGKSETVHYTIFYLCIVTIFMISYKFDLFLLTLIILYNTK